MKAVVLEIKDGMAAVLKEDGTIIKISRPCNVGDEIVLTDAELGWAKIIPFKHAKLVASVAALVIVVGLGTGSYYMTALADTQVTVGSGDYQVKLTLNKLNRVIKVEAEGVEAQDVVEELRKEGIRNQKLDKPTDVTDKQSETNDEGAEAGGQNNNSQVQTAPESNSSSDNKAEDSQNSSGQESAPVKQPAAPSKEQEQAPAPPDNNLPEQPEGSKEQVPAAPDQNSNQQPQPGQEQAPAGQDTIPAQQNAPAQPQPPAGQSSPPSPQPEQYNAQPPVTPGPGPNK